jgi:hypothetical protein
MPAAFCYLVPEPSTWVTPLIGFAAVGLPASGPWELQTVERIFNSDRKGTHWGKRKLKRDR